MTDKKMTYYDKKVLFSKLTKIKANLDDPDYQDKIYSASFDLKLLINDLKKFL